MIRKILKLFLILITILINIGLDQITKYIASSTLKNQGIVPVAGNFFVLVYTENSGAFLSLGTNWLSLVKTIIFIALPLVALVAIIVYMIRSEQLETAQLVCLACISGGGLSNLYDRIFHHGLVTDFMNFGIGSLRTGVLNVADLSITFGCAVLFLLLLKPSGKTGKA